MTDSVKLLRYCAEAEGMLELADDEFTPKWHAWNTCVKRALSNLFGENGIEVKAFCEISCLPIPLTTNPSDAACAKGREQGLQEAIELLKALAEELSEEEQPDKNPANEQAKDFNKVFIAHGHDEELREDVKAFIEDKSLEAVILKEQPSYCRAIIEKIEANCNVGCAICLFTADDFGYDKDKQDTKPRARQNVVFETGLLMGKLERSRIILIHEEGVEEPSDLKGVAYIDKDDWQNQLPVELGALGYKI